MIDYKKKYLKYKDKYSDLIKESSIKSESTTFNEKLLQITKKQLTGGAIISSYDELKKYLQSIITNTTKLNTFTNCIYNYYVFKINKYKKLMKKRTSDTKSIIEVDMINKKQFAYTVGGVDALKLEEYNGHSALDDTAIAKALAQNGTYIKYKKIIRKIEDKLKKINSTYIKENMEKMLEKMDKFDTDNMNIIRLEILEYLIHLSIGKINVDTFTPFNIILKGHAGIGKSTAARQIAEILSLSQLLCIGNLKNVKKPDIIGQFIGQTAPLVYTELSNGLESIIFLDEAYSITGPRLHTGKFNQYGKEAIDAIVDFASEHQSLVSIIAAGYPAEMKTQFLDVNQGMSRRFKLNCIMERYKIKDILTISNNLAYKQLNRIYNENKGILTEAQMYMILVNLLNEFCNMVWFFDYTLYNKDEELSSMIKEEKRGFFESKLSGEMEKAGFIGANIHDGSMFGENLRSNPILIDKKFQPWNHPMKLFLSDEEIYKSGTVNLIFSHYGHKKILPILVCKSDKRLPFNYPNTNNGIEWFFLLFLLDKTTNLSNGDLFKSQAAAVIDYADNYINSYTLTEFAVRGYDKDTFLRVSNTHLKSIFKNKDIVYEKSDETLVEHRYEDTKQYISNTISKFSQNNNLPRAQVEAILELNAPRYILQILFEEMLIEFNSLLELEEDNKNRRYNIFSLNQIKNMNKTVKDFKTHIDTMIIEDSEFKIKDYEPYKDNTEKPHEGVQLPAGADGIIPKIDYKPEIDPDPDPDPEIEPESESNESLMKEARMIYDRMNFPTATIQGPSDLSRAKVLLFKKIFEILENNKLDNPTEWNAFKQTTLRPTPRRQLSPNSDVYIGIKKAAEDANVDFGVMKWAENLEFNNKLPDLAKWVAQGPRQAKGKKDNDRIISAATVLSNHSFPKELLKKMIEKR